jgi:dihydrodipicolinate synthase/N-acetylneuraminate lyase
MGVAGVKYACDFNGYYGGRARSPLLPVTAADKTEIEELLTGLRN